MITRASNSNNNNTKGRRISHGTALEPRRLPRRAPPRQQRPRGDEDGGGGGGVVDDDLSELFVAMCFYARLGFDQPPRCLRCEYRDATRDAAPDENDDGGGGGGSETNDRNDAARIGECHNLIPWRIDASILLHPARLVALAPSSPPSPHDAANDNTANNSSNTTDDDEENDTEDGGGGSGENGGGGGGSNIVFITCTTAQCLVNGECYPCLRYDGRNKRLLLF